MLYRLISGKSGIVSFFLSFVYLVFTVFRTFKLAKGEYLFESLALHLLVQQTIVFCSAFFANRQLLKHKLVSIGDYTLFFMLFITLSSIANSIENLRLLAGLLSTIMLIGRVKAVFNQQNSTLTEFDIGIFSALAYVAHPVFVFVLPYALISVLIIKANDWRDYLAVITGFGFVILLKASYYVFVDRITDIPKILALSFQLKSFHVINFFEPALLGLMLFFALFTIHNNLKISDKMNIKERLYYKLWLSLFVFMFLPFLLILNQVTLLQVALFLLFPLLILIQPFVLKKKKAYINDFLLFMLLFFCISVKLLH